jgi:ketosteroid isomerase-like protein
MEVEPLVLSLFDAFSRRDVEAMSALAHPELRFWPQGTLELTGRHEPYAGPEGLRRYAADAAAGWASLELQPRDVRVAGDGAIVFGVVHGVTRAGERIDRQAIWVFKVRDGKILSCRAVATAEEAAQRAAAGG